VAFAKDLRDLLEATQEIDIETRSATGRTHRVPIWVVVDGDAVFARSYAGPEARWYRELLARPGAIVVGDRSYAVRAVPAIDEASVAATSRGYRLKYSHSRSLRAMQRPEIHPTTVRLEPAGEY
jgi:hypothetical protein